MSTLSAIGGITPPALPPAATRSAEEATESPAKERMERSEEPGKGGRLDALA